MDPLSDQYNARALAPEAVAATFVAPMQFVEMVANRNTVLIGSRGSGKTTLLRMLDPRAQVEWVRRAEAQEVCSSIGIFVPMDASWLASLRSTYLNPSDCGRVALAIYSLTMMRSAIDCMIYRLGVNDPSNPYAAKINFESEAAFVAELERLLFTEFNCGTLVALRFRLTSHIAVFPRQIGHLSEGKRSEVIAHLSDPVTLAAVACELFNQATYESGRRWFLLCDELEIAPDEVHEALFTALRAPPAVVNLKLAMTPVVRALGQRTANRPLPAHDFDVVSLAYSTRGEGAESKAREKFCHRIWEQLTEQMFPGRVPQLSNPFKVLDEPDLATPVRRRGARSMPVGKSADRYSPMFHRLSSVDISFRKYLEEKGVDPKNIDQCSPELMDSVVRKVAPLVEARLFYRAPPGSRQTRVSRRSNVLYAGTKRLFDLSEGHPRWLKANVGRMLSKLDTGSRISLEVQSVELTKSVDRINARLAALPSAVSRQTSPQVLVDRIGLFFSQQVLGEDFIADPYLSFFVDDDCSQEIVESLEAALNIGALVPMAREAGGLLHDGLVGKRLRLSYWLAPKFRLPLLVGKAIQLTSLLSSSRDSSSTFGRQLDLLVSK